MRSPTVSTTTYDNRRRPIRMTTTRTPDGGAMAPDLGAVSVVFDQELEWDAASNLKRLIDLRDPAEWPDGHRPQTVMVTHDDLYRVIEADMEYRQSSGAWTTEDGFTDWRDDYQSTRPVDPMRPDPAARVPAAPGDDARVRTLRWEYDFLANQTVSDDDNESFYERSIGRIVNGADLGVGYRPSALYLATNLRDNTSDPLDEGGGGWLEVYYDTSGNVRELAVHGQCLDMDVSTECYDDTTLDLDDRRDHLRSHCRCTSEEDYQYRWDELNRLVDAIRHHRDGGTGNPWYWHHQLRYRYDANNRRLIKWSQDAVPATGEPADLIALTPYPGDFERRGLVRGSGTYDASSVVNTETQYLVAGARVVWQHPVTSPSTFEAGERITFPISDLIHTSAAVIDARTGALLEASTYYPDGSRETFLNDPGSLVAAEPMGFTGKEADEEVGLVYFGERWLIPRIGRWASPDPLHVHASGGGEALNSYHYVSGNLLASRDPLGLDVVSSGENPPDVAADGGGSHYAVTTPDHPPPDNTLGGIESGGTVYHGCDGPCSWSAPPGNYYGSPGGEASGLTTQFEASMARGYLRGFASAPGRWVQGGGALMAMTGFGLLLGGTAYGAGSVERWVADEAVLAWWDIPQHPPGLRHAEDEFADAVGLGVDLAGGLLLAEIGAAGEAAGAEAAVVIEEAERLRNYPVNISTAGYTVEEAAAIREYARRVNAWLDEVGPRVIQSTKGTLRNSANRAARAERSRAALAGAPYRGQAGHVPDTAISGTPDPPAGWLDMPGKSNSVCGGVLGCRIGQVIDHFTVDGLIP
ncbi:MAG: RHS repeat-associated core domain-containing protein [Sandaracinaceae bacterium]